MCIRKIISVGELNTGAIFMPCKVCLPRQSNEFTFALQGIFIWEAENGKEIL